jgi:hypothetical protein
MGYDSHPRWSLTIDSCIRESDASLIATPAGWRVADSVAEVADTGRLLEAMLAMLRLGKKTA